MDRLKIAKVFFARPHLGGSGIMALATAKELVLKGHQVDIVSYPGTFLTEEEKEVGLNIHPVDAINYPCFKSEPYNATLASQIVNLDTQRDGLDIIHAHYAITHGDAALAAAKILRRKGRNPKVVITSHGSDIHTNGHHQLLAPHIEHLLSSADAITFISRALQDEASRIFQLEYSGEVIPNFVDEMRFHPADNKKKRALRIKLGIPEDATVVYHASNFRPVKQTELFPECARKVFNQNRNVYFLMVGDGPDKAQVETKAKE